MIGKMNRLWTLVLLSGFLCPGLGVAADPPVKTGERRDTLLYIRTVPAGAKVLLEGKELGVSDGMFSVDPGVQTIVVELDGHEKSTKRVTVEAHRVTRVEIDLKPGTLVGDKPRIVSMSPPNGANDVDPKLRELRVTFDRPMAGGFSWTGGGPQFPKTSGNAYWTEDQKTCVLPVELKPNWQYRLGLNSVSYQNFQSQSGVALTPVEYVFKTRAAENGDGAATDQNLLSNGGMEEGDRTPNGWEQGAAIPGVRYSWDKNVARQGKASLSIAKTANRYFPIAQWSQTIPHNGDAQALEVSASVKAKDMTKAVLDVIFLDKDGRWISHEWAAYIGSKQQGDSPANHDWKTYSGRVKVPHGTAKIHVALQDYGPGRVWFDEVQAKYVSLDSPEEESMQGDSEGNAEQRAADNRKLTKLLQAAKAGNYWSKYELWAAYHKGTIEGVEKNPEEAQKWLAELVKGAHRASFRPTNGFAPTTPHEFLRKFGEHSNLRSEPAALGGASFFRTTAKDGTLIGSFLTAYPEKMRQAIADNPFLELISIEPLTPEMFIRHDASSQESLK